MPIVVKIGNNEAKIGQIERNYLRTGVEEAVLACKINMVDMIYRISEQRGGIMPRNVLNGGD